MASVQLFILGLVATVAGGCADAARSAWIRENGGLVATDGASQARVDRLAAQITRSCAGCDVVVRILDTDAVAAFSWRTGEVYITRGLLERADDNQAAAALAHELGHLLADGRLRGVVSLNGDERDCESRADLIGVRLLAAAGIPAGAMTSMLQIVRDAPGTPLANRNSLDLRIDALNRETSPR